MQILRQFFSQTKKPEGFLGALMLRGMNSGHAELADWALSLMPGIAPQSAVDLGCGGGRNIAALQKKYPHANVDGFDYSALSVEKAIKYNASAIAQNNCTIAVGDVSNLKPQKKTTWQLLLKQFIFGQDSKNVSQTFSICLTITPISSSSVKVTGKIKPVNNSKNGLMV